jgi:hypothetical protein
LPVCEGIGVIIAPDLKSKLVSINRNMDDLFGAVDHPDRRARKQGLSMGKQVVVVERFAFGHDDLLSMTIT